MVALLIRMPELPQAIVQQPQTHWDTVQSVLNRLYFPKHWPVNMRWDYTPQAAMLVQVLAVDGQPIQSNITMVSIMAPVIIQLD